MRKAEHQRLEETRTRTKHWRRWGPYLAERQWGTVREDYSATGDPWQYLTYDMAPAYAYRWGEDGIGGWSDNHQRLCFALALWNGRDSMLKERLFGLNNHEGNHGEDVKECYWLLDGTPTHSYMRYLYRYPHQAFPYQHLRDENAQRGRKAPEFELIETGIFDGDAYFDITIEYAKADCEDTIIRIEAHNAGEIGAELHLLPTLWFRNTWKWAPGSEKPALRQVDPQTIHAEHSTLGRYSLETSDAPKWLFTENESNTELLYAAPNEFPHTKDAFHRCIIAGDTGAVEEESGTKAAAWNTWTLGPGERRAMYLRLRNRDHSSAETPWNADMLDLIIADRKTEADSFYATVLPPELDEEGKDIARQALAGMVWSKQYYHYVVEQWLSGDPAMPPPSQERSLIRNDEWGHLYNDDILSMPDTWEFPWFAVWDSAFHAIPFAHVDLEYAKRQIAVFTREWYMHPNGQLPAYEWDFSDVNPPVHAWAAWRVYCMEKSQHGAGDTAFLESVFHKLLMNFTWWVNQKDPNGDNVFQGGFLGMDNIGVFDWTAPLPVSGYVEQSDCTSWMAMYCLNMLRISWELSHVNAAYEDIASKFFEHFLHIADAIFNIGGTGASLWDEEDGFFYDQLQTGKRGHRPLRIRSMVGLIPLLAVEILDHEHIAHLPGFERRMNWFFENRSDLTNKITCIFEKGHKGRCLLSLLDQEQLRRVLARMLDEDEFLSPYGIRSLSQFHREHPYVFSQDRYTSTVNYQPGESESSLFGGNSNWRGPVWFPVNFLIIEALRRYYAFWGDDFQVECPTGSGKLMHLGAIADELARRLISLFRLDGDRRPLHGDSELLQQPAWRDVLPFPEYFHGDSGAGLGASHQTGWTGLVATLLIESGEGRAVDLFGGSDS